MQKRIIFYFIACLLLLKYTYIKAQQVKGQIVVNAGAGYSPGFDGDIITPNGKFNIFNSPYLFNNWYPVAVNP